MITKKTSKEEVIKIASKCDVSKDCRSCMECCKKSSGLVLDEDIPRIAKFLGKTEKEFKKEFLEEIEMYGKVIHKLKLKKYPVGECVFLKDGCSINEVKPLHCKTGTWDSKNSESCYQWFVWNHLVDETKEESMKQWKEYTKCKNTIE